MTAFDSSTEPASPARPSPERLFPTLTAAQMQRIAAQGRLRPVAAGDVLVEVGDRQVPFFVVVSGAVEVIAPSGGAAETFIVKHTVGHFTGETSMITGRPALVRLTASEAGEVLEVERERLLEIVQNDGELSEIFMRAFILRRVDIIARGLGDVVLLGSNYCAATLRVREFLTRNGHPFAFVDLDRDADVQMLLDRFEVTEEDVPVLICRGEVVLRNPSNHEIGECLGFNEGIDQVRLRDLVIVGAGPAGLAAAVYGASEGLDVLVLESTAPGGQAGSSSRIENYLGFPAGITGQELAGRAYAQAQKFGAQIVIAEGAAQLTCARAPYAVQTDQGPRIPARAVIIATGARYRKPPLENLSRFENAGVYYAATQMEAQLCNREEVIVVGGGNSAGQAAVFLAQSVKRVHLLVRGNGLADTMSRYLSRRIEDNPAIVLRPHTELERIDGEDHLERVQWRNNKTGAVESHDIRHLFMMTGATPNTTWLGSCIALDEKGFIKTGPDLTPEDLIAAEWPLPRAPYLLETSRPGVFAVGDVRSGNVKRVASAVGEGSIAVAFVHRVLQE